MADSISPTAEYIHIATRTGATATDTRCRVGRLYWKLGWICVLEWIYMPIRTSLFTNNGNYGYLSIRPNT